jgi:hypothetical protein
VSVFEVKSAIDNLLLHRVHRSASSRPSKVRCRILTPNITNPKVTRVDVRPKSCGGRMTRVAGDDRGEWRTLGAFGPLSGHN